MEPANFRSQGAAAPWRKNIARIQRLSKVVNQKEGHVLRRQAKRGAEEKKGKEPIVERGEKGSFSNGEFLFPHPYFSSTSFSSVFLLSWHSASRRTLTRYEHSNWPVKSLNWHSSFPLCTPVMTTPGYISELLSHCNEKLRFRAHDGLKKRRGSCERRRIHGRRTLRRFLREYWTHRGLECAWSLFGFESRQVGFFWNGDWWTGTRETRFLIVEYTGERLKYVEENGRVKRFCL